MAQSETFTIRTPCSSANIGPGFDVIGLALSIYLELTVTIDRSKTSSELPLNCRITYEGEGENSGDISLDPPRTSSLASPSTFSGAMANAPSPSKHMFTSRTQFPRPWPGSSGAAVVAGVMLGKEVGSLHHLDNDRLFDFCLMIERHPDNVGAALFGGFVGTYLKPLSPEDVARVEIPLSEVLPEPAGGVDTGKSPPEPPFGIGHRINFPWAKEIKAIAIIPDFVVATHDARSVLPKDYSRADVTFNLQRIALLPVALGQSPPDPELIYLAMQDKIHQPYRSTLIPGLGEIVSSMSPPRNRDSSVAEIANKIIAILKKSNPKPDLACQWRILEPANGTEVISTPSCNNVVIFHIRPKPAENTRSRPLSPS
ncbi:unnamed protein product [Parascedosporium putredinis]|uniref:Homoserine kinase n=1 Tax=Parascedosporium putredinis TaxID=1442378 RepID=A0A9P1M9K9_9PEZI|nr:unnamed protein product [Parascedosporium putredinis]CAI7995834.1 unnamed protein product [Parascedosporium putredinis]